MALIADFRAAASDLVQRSQLARWAGKTFGGNRDIDEALGYKRNLTIQDFRNRYERGGISARVIEAKPESTWRGTGEVIEVEEPDTITQFEQAFMDLNKRLDIWSSFYHADVMAGIGRYAGILLIAPGKLEDPIPDPLKPDDLYNLMTFAEDELKIHEQDLERNTETPRFAMPNFYELTRLQPRNGLIQKVHWSRIVHIRAEGVPDGVLFGPPRLLKPWNYFDDLAKVVGGGAEAFWVRAHQGYVFNLDKDADLKDDKKNEMRDQLDEFINGMRRVLRLQGVEAKTLGSDVADFSGPASSILDLISSTTGIPKRILMGSERGELASTQDRENWSDRIDDRRTQYAHPMVVKPFVQRLIDIKALPTPKEFSTRWPDQMSLTETEKADLTVKLTKANQQQGEDIITTDEIRDRIYGMTPVKTDQRRQVPPAPPINQGDLDSAFARVAKERPPAIHVTTPPVNVTVPAAAAPIVNITLPSDRARSKVFTYNSAGQIVGSKEVEE